jgi:beta-mannosidase
VKDQIQIEFRARSLARLVEVSLDGVDAVFSDNYFDLPAGRSMTITTSLPTGWKISQVQTALKIQSIYNSFAH